MLNKKKAAEIRQRGERGEQRNEKKTRFPFREWLELLLAEPLLFFCSELLLLLHITTDFFPLLTLPTSPHPFLYFPIPFAFIFGVFGFLFSPFWFLLVLSLFFIVWLLEASSLCQHQQHHDQQLQQRSLKVENYNKQEVELTFVLRCLIVIRRRRRIFQL